MISENHISALCTSCKLFAAVYYRFFGKQGNNFDFLRKSVGYYNFTIFNLCNVVVGVVNFSSFTFKFVLAFCLCIYSAVIKCDNKLCFLIGKFGNCCPCITFGFRIAYHEVNVVDVNFDVLLGNFCFIGNNCYFIVVAAFDNNLICINCSRSGICGIINNIAVNVIECIA